jgi:hypothetical protein
MNSIQSTGIVTLIQTSKMEGPRDKFERIVSGLIQMDAVNAPEPWIWRPKKDKGGRLSLLDPDTIRKGRLPGADRRRRNHPQGRARQRSAVV